MINLNDKIFALKTHRTAVCRDVLVNRHIPDVQERAETDYTTKSVRR
jgi:hypothetical protein